MPTWDEIKTDRFGTDIDLTLTENRGSGTGGAAPTLSGVANIYSWLLDSAVTTPGSLVHRPDFGGGLQDNVGRLGTPAVRARMANDVRKTWLTDRRVTAASVSVSEGEDLSQTIIEAQVLLATETEPRGFEAVTGAADF